MNGSAVNGSAVNGNTAPNGSVANGSAVNGVASLTNTITITPAKDAAAGVEGYLDPCDAGQLEACAAERITEMEAAASKEGGDIKVTTPTTAAGTPYMNPGGRWSQFRNYSVFQVCDVVRVWWGRVLVFCVDYILQFVYAKHTQQCTTNTTKYTHPIPHHPTPHHPTPPNPSVHLIYGNSPSPFSSSSGSWVENSPTPKMA